MTSTVLNVIFNKLLANFLEIDTSKTNISILSGRIKLENLKIKREIFEYYYIPYFELLHGYVGSLDIDLKMPFFYMTTAVFYVENFRQRALVIMQSRFMILLYMLWMTIPLPVSMHWDR